jgi:acyl-CoA synthetase (AMP-forming)/AMP-acid ligase II
LASDDFLDEHGLVASPNRVAMPGAPLNVATILEGPLAGDEGKTAVVDRHCRLTYGVLERRVNAATAFLASLGLKPGDRIAATAQNSADLITAFLASQRLGAIWVGINRNYAPAEKRYFLEDSQASLYLADDDAIAQTDEVPVRKIGFQTEERDSEWMRGLVRHAGAERTITEIDSWAPAAIAYTSGTTGRPKGAVHSQHNMIVAATMAQLMAKDRTAEIVRGMTSPMTILNMMILGAVATLSKGHRLVCMDRTDARGIADWIRDERITTTTLVPTIVRDLLTRPDIHPGELESLDWLVVGGSMVPKELPALYEQRFGSRMTTGYGQTEMPTAISRTHEATPDAHGAVGRPLPHIDVQVLDEQDRPVSPNLAGEICLRATEVGPYARVYTPPLGYWNRPAETAKLLRNGWLHTGDVGHLDEAGELFVHDRRSDLIVRGGANVYPAEVERVLRDDPRVVDCAVLGLPDERLGQTVAVVIVVRDTDDERIIGDLQARCAEELARYKNPVQWLLVDDLPRNAMGKVMKRELVKLFSRRTADGWPELKTR